MDGGWLFVLHGWIFPKRQRYPDRPPLYRIYPSIPARYHIPSFNTNRDWLYKPCPSALTTHRLYRPPTHHPVSSRLLPSHLQTVDHVPADYAWSVEDLALSLGGYKLELDSQKKAQLLGMRRCFYFSVLQPPRYCFESRQVENRQATGISLEYCHNALFISTPTDIFMHSHPLILHLCAYCYHISRMERRQST